MAAERSGAGRLIVHADQELPAFLELESAIKTYRHNHECDCPEPDEELENVADNLRKPVSVAAVSQGRIKASDNFGLWAADARTRDVLLCMLTSFLELQDGKSCVAPCFAECPNQKRPRDRVDEN